MVILAKNTARGTEQDLLDGFVQRDGWIAIPEDGIALPHRLPRDDKNVELIILDDFTSDMPPVQETHGYYVEQIAQGIFDDPIRADYGQINPAQAITLAHVAMTLIEAIDSIDPAILELNVNASQNNETIDIDLVVVNMSWVILRCVEKFEVLSRNPRGTNQSMTYFNTVTVSIPDFIEQRDIESGQNLVEYIVELAENNTQSCIIDYGDPYSDIVTEYTSTINRENQEDLYNALEEEIPEECLSSLEAFLSEIVVAEDLEELATAISLSEDSFNFASVRNGLSTTIGSVAFETATIEGTKQDCVAVQENGQQPDDTVIGCLKWILNNDLVLGVAASGNMNLALTSQSVIEIPDDDNNNGIRDAFTPAAWSEVIAVSGTRALAPSLDRLPLMWMPSHDGEIAAPAAWHYFWETGEIGSGTSFAAPIISGLIARFAIRGCTVTNLRDNVEEHQNIFYLEAFDEQCAN